MNFSDLLTKDPALVDCIKQIRLIAFDFDGVFTDNMVYVFEDGAEAVRCCRSDGIGLKKLHKVSVETIVISTETNPVVSARSKKLGIHCIQGCSNKLEKLESVCRKKRLLLSQVAFMGNDVNDLTCLKVVGFPVIVQDAHPDVISLARYRTLARGGHGAVRELCDLIAEVYSNQG